MAQLPPKAPPNITHNYWPSFIPHHKLPSSMPNFVNSTTNGGGSTTAAAGGGGGGSVGGTTTAMAMSNNGNSNNNNQGCNWVDEFLDFSSVRRGAHRRSISDSIAFLDPPTMLLEEECRNSNGNAAAAVNMRETNCFDRLDDEQLMSMFSDDIAVSLPPTTASSSNPSTPSDQNSNNDDQKTTPLDPQQKPKNEPGEVESSCKSEGQNTQTQHAAAVNSNGDSFNIDPKRVKRILANRQSAQRSRVRKLQYISELERSVTTLQTEVSALSPRVAFLDHQRLILGVDNSALKQRIAALAQDKIFKDAHQEALKKEIERLRQIYHHQQQQQQQNQLNKMENNNNINNSNNSTELAAAAAPVQQPMNIDNHDHHQLLS